MNIKTRLAVQFTLISTIIILFFSILVYYFYYSSQLSKFRQYLLNSSKNTATLLIDVAEVDSTLLQKIQRSTILRAREEMAVTDSTFRLIYGNNIEYLNDSTRIAHYSDDKLNYFSIRDKDGVFYKHIYDNHRYYVYTMAYDQGRVENLTELRKILFWSLIFGIWFSVLLSYLFARRAIRPISNIIKSVREINSLKLNNRLDEGNKKDELAQLSMTFNQMMSDLEIAFKNQEDFVSNASHELRTPLTVVIGEGEYILDTDRSKEEYVKHISDTNKDLKYINNLLTNLLELAQIGRGKDMISNKVRLDEILFESITRVKSRYTGRKIIPKLLYPENGETLIIDGNEGLLTIAFQNLLDNACKFSNNDIDVNFIITDNFINIIIRDSGIGIPEEELVNVYKPFSRASNAKFIGGFGIGLALVSKIIELHKASISIASQLDKGTRIEVLFTRNAN